MSKTVAIAGFGWLGQPFAQHLQLLGYTVKGSVTSLKKATLLQKSGFDVFPVEISEGGVSDPVNAFLSETDYLVIMIPPGVRNNTGADYVLKMTHFLNEIKKTSLKKIILVSSISVYGNAQGSVTEKDEPIPETQAGKQLLQVEQLFAMTEELNTTIIRFGGLFGGSRQPVRYLAGRTDLHGGNAPVNLIHRDDCINILSGIIKQEAFGHLFNAVIPIHPTKEVYYSQRALEFGLMPPKFASAEPNEVFKQVDSQTLEAILNYTFLTSHL